MDFGKAGRTIKVMGRSFKAGRTYERGISKVKSAGKAISEKMARKVPKKWIVWKGHNISVPKSALPKSKVLEHAKKALPYAATAVGTGAAGYALGRRKSKPGSKKFSKGK